MDYTKGDRTGHRGRPSSPHSTPIIAEDPPPHSAESDTGIEKRLSRYGQFYSRVGFVHQFRPLSAEELRFLLEQKWQELGVPLDRTSFDDVEAMTAVIRITGGNFRLVQRPFAQVARILSINHLERVSKEVVEAARDSLVIGPA